MGSRTAFWMFIVIIGFQIEFNYGIPTKDSENIHCPEPTGRFSHPKYCDLFINCWNSEGRVDRCGAWLVFNEKIKGCDYPENVDCGGRGLYITQTPPSTNEPPTDEEGIVAQVTLYQDTHHRGASHHIDIRYNYCINLPYWLDDESSSLNTHNTCVRICEHRDCNGHCVTIKPRSNCHRSLEECNMNDKVSSVKQCNWWDII